MDTLLTVCRHHVYNTAMAVNRGELTNRVKFTQLYIYPTFLISAININNYSIVLQQFTMLLNVE